MSLHAISRYLPRPAAVPQLSPPPVVQVLNRSDAFWIGYDRTKKTALWVHEYLSQIQLKKPREGRSRSNFKPDGELEATCQASKEAYRNSGWTKGHLAASGNWRKKAIRNLTYKFTNIVPMEKRFNNITWNKVEEFVRDLALDFPGAHVVTGPIFGENPPLLKDTDIPIPDSVFKAVLIEEAGQVPLFIGIEGDNRPDGILRSCSMEALQERTGLVLFPEVDIVKEVALSILFKDNNVDIIIIEESELDDDSELYDLHLHQLFRLEEVEKIAIEVLTGPGSESESDEVEDSHDYVHGIIVQNRFAMLDPFGSSEEEDEGEGTGSESESNETDDSGDYLQGILLHNRFAMLDPFDSSDEEDEEVLLILPK